MKILLIAIVGSKNFGDEAMFKAIYKSLIDRGHSVTVATYEVEEAKKRFPDVKFIKIPTTSLKNLVIELSGFSTLGLDISAFDALYISGGGNLNSLYPFHVVNIFSMVREFRKKGKYVEFRPQSVGPFYGKTRILIEHLVNKIVKMSDVFYVRELLSYEYLRKKHQNVKLSKADAWYIPTDGSVFLLRGRYVGLCVRPWKDEEVLIDYVARLVSYLKERGYEPLFIPIAYGGTRKYIDNEFLKGKVYGTFLSDIVEIENLTPEMIKGVIAKCCFTIGMSYHFNIFSLSTGVPSAAVYMEDYYRIKNLGVYKAFGNPELVFKIPDTSPKHLVDRMINEINGRQGGSK
jgi:polysaccharide pyruvyl transferase WcaK-like protein